MYGQIRVKSLDSGYSWLDEDIFNLDDRDESMEMAGSLRFYEENGYEVEVIRMEG